MDKRKIFKRLTLILIFIIVFGILWTVTSCMFKATVGQHKTKVETISLNQNETDSNSYFIFRTNKAEEYLKFLEEFDETKYEIVNISAGSEGSYNLDVGAYYFVTYKKKAESK